MLILIGSFKVLQLRISLSKSINVFFKNILTFSFLLFFLFYFMFRYTWLPRMALKPSSGPVNLTLQGINNACHFLQRPRRENYISHYWQRHKKHIWDGGGLESGLYSHTVVISRYKSRREGECWTNRRLLAAEVVGKSHIQFDWNHIDLAISFYARIDYLKWHCIYKASYESSAKTFYFFYHTDTLSILLCRRAVQFVTRVKTLM